MVLSIFRKDLLVENRAHIICHQHQLPLGKYYTTYEWEGKKNWPIFIDDRFLGIYGVPRIKTFPWPLKLVDRQGDMLISVYMRTDTTFPHWWITKLRISIGKFIHPIYCRLILTAMVWGLAYVPDYEVPSWKHLGKRK